ncbi:MAG: hypothetical protein AVDCRST_MAG47-2982, partial [uncultured Nocardioidaceae bacterium]
GHIRRRAGRAGVHRQVRRRDAARLRRHVRLLLRPAPRAEPLRRGTEDLQPDDGRRLPQLLAGVEDDHVRRDRRTPLGLLRPRHAGSSRHESRLVGGAL